MNSGFPGETFFQWLAEEVDLTGTERAPARLKSRIYSSLTRQLADSGPLLSLSQHQNHGLCVFEQLVKIAPVGEAIKSLNPCRVCHARFLAERLEHAPIYWPNCPYVDFQEE